MQWWRREMREGRRRPRDEERRGILCGYARRGGRSHCRYPRGTRSRLWWCDFSPGSLRKTAVSSPARRSFSTTAVTPAPKPSSTAVLEEENSVCGEIGGHVHCFNTQGARLLRLKGGEGTRPPPTRAMHPLLLQLERRAAPLFGETTRNNNRRDYLAQ
uniref:Uncharacterized protein n=1 Tax=Arundo donax TaxID=35708 RepID=A0A0A8ZPP5_ARUDO